MFLRQSSNKRSRREKLPALLILLLMAFLSGCKETDDIPPVITLEGSEEVEHVLNAVYNDQGAKAIDETDGDITKNIYVENTVDADKLGEYTVTYRVVDQAGNEAIPVVRTVVVHNQAEIYSSDYSVSELQIFPSTDTCFYEISARADSFTNNRIIFSSFACDFGQEVYAEVEGSDIIIPFQLISDTTIEFTLQGSGWINDTAMVIVTHKTDTLDELWEAEIIRLK